MTDWFQEGRELWSPGLEQSGTSYVFLCVLVFLVCDSMESMLKTAL